MKTILNISLFLLAQTLFSQDILIMKNGDEKKVKIKEVNPTTIRYVNFDNQDGPLYTDLKSIIFMVKYENGTKELFQEQSTEVALPEHNFSEQRLDRSNADVIYTTSGETIKCTIESITPSAIAYHVERSGPDKRAVIAMSKVQSFENNQKNFKETISVINNTKPKTDDDDAPIEVRKYAGPRVGFTCVGDGAMQQSLSAEGKRIVFSQFGWQFEKRMFTLKNGLSGMVEFVPMIGGLDLGKFIPSVSGFLAMRLKNGFEFGLGPNLGIYGGRNPAGGTSTSANVGVIFATGMSIKSGKVNFPINIAFVPSVTKQQDVYNKTTGKNEKVSYETGAKVSIIVGFNNRKS